MALADRLRSIRQQFPTHVAMVAGSDQWTYADLDADSDRVAAGLSRLGVAKGDRVALMLSNRPELVIAYWACFKLGAIAVPINNRFAAPELAYTLNHSESRVCITQSDLYPKLQEIRTAPTSTDQIILVDSVPETLGILRFADLLKFSLDGIVFPTVEETAVAAILYTSGTTSRPKGVTHTHRSLELTALNHGAHIALDSDDIVCVIPPMCHILGFATQMIAPLLAGARLILLPSTNPEFVLQTLQEQQVTRIAGLPVFYQSLVNHPRAAEFSLKTLRTCIGGGDAVPVALQERFQSWFGVSLLEGCGMTEVIPFTLNLPGEHRPGSIGRACPGMSIRLVDDAGQDVPPGGTGEILVRSDAAMIGYWKEPEISAVTLADGYIHTGDLGRVDDDGYYWFMGRKKEIIIRGGSNISPLEVEEVLYQHPAVRECGVVGVPNAEWGEVIWAYVATRQSAMPTELQQFLQQHLATYKVPETIQFLPELPKGPTGKIHRRTLRERAMREVAAPA